MKCISVSFFHFIVDISWFQTCFVKMQTVMKQMMLLLVPELLCTVVNIFLV